MTRRGFTLLELALASAIGSIVILVAASMFFAMERSERASAAVFERTVEFGTTQVAVRRAFQRLAMAASDTSNGESTNAVLAPRPRMVLERDAGAGDPGVMRFEMVVSRPPLSQALAGPAATWAFADEDRANMNFLSPDGSGGQTRGVFELRPDGHRERVMTQLGIPNPLWGPRDADPPAIGAGEAQGWTLWWRRLGADEVFDLASGLPPRADNPAGGNEEARRLAGSVRMVRGLTMLEWSVFKGDQWVSEFEAMVVRDLPAYIKLRVRTAQGVFAEWLFEVDWSTVNTVDADAAALQLALAEAQANGETLPGQNPPADDGPVSREDQIEPARGLGPRTRDRVKVIRLDERRREQQR